MQNNEIKQHNLNILADYHDRLCKNPQLRHLFLELTLKCNERCFHCGSGCAADQPDGLLLRDYVSVLENVKEHFGPGVHIAVTGGEPLLYPDFLPLIRKIHEMGFHWGMTSNATLITKEIAHELHENRMYGISISIDGLPETHDRYRRTPGGYDRAMRGIQNLIDEGGFGSIMVTTVVNHENIRELPALYDVFNDVDINEWRLTGLEPIGRAMDHPELLLTPEDNRELMEFIRDKRRQKIPVTYSCCHYLGPEYEAEVRDWYFLCNAGVYTAGILVNGDVTACLDIPHNEKTVQGNIFETPFDRIWMERFEIFRTHLSARNETCASCSHERFCRGGSSHSWDYDKEQPKICMKGILFD